MKPDNATEAAGGRSGWRAITGVLAGAVTTVLIFSLGLRAVAGRVAAGHGAARALSGLGSCATRPDDCGTGVREAGGTVVIGTLGRLDGASPHVEAAVLAMVAPSPFVVLPSGAFRHNRDLLRDPPRVVSTRPYAVVYKIKPEARWNDGMPISAADFSYSWRARGERAGYDQITAVAGSDNGKTVKVTFASEYPQWRQLFRYLSPAHAAADAAPARGWGAVDGTRLPPVPACPPPWQASPGWSGGPYRVTAFRADQAELAPNPSWYGADVPSLDRVIFRLFPDSKAALLAAERGELDGLRIPLDPESLTRIDALAGRGFSRQVSGTGNRSSVFAISSNYVNIRDNSVSDGTFTINSEQWGVAAAR